MSTLVSIIVPVYAAGDVAVADLDACLDGIRRAEGGNELDVIVVDDASPRAEAISAVARRYAARLERLNQRSGPAVARNHGAALARHSVLVFLDADTVPLFATLRQLQEAFDQDPELAAVFGSYDDKPSDPGLMSRFRNLQHHWIHQHSKREASTFWAGCGAIRQAAFASVGGFDETYRHASIEDVALGMKMKAAGLRIELHPGIQVTHRKRWTLGSALRTDLFSRAVPWTAALWGGATLPTDLNFTWKHKASTLLAVCVLAGWAASIWVSVAAAVLLAILNLPFYRFLWSRGGATLAAVGFAGHTLHYFVSVVGFGLGTLRVFPMLSLLPVVVVAMQWSTGAYSADYGELPDENAHAVSGLMVSEWLRNPSIDVMGFAERYYVSYPVLGIGHWPPLFYLLEGAWFRMAGASRAAALLLIAAIATLLLACVYVPVRRSGGAIAAASATALVCINAHFVEATSVVMLDLCAALAVMAAAWCWVRYLDQPSASRAAWFGVAASASLLVKQSTLVLIPLPLLSIAIARRWDLMFRPHFWLPAALVIAIAGPWHLYTMQTIYSDIAFWGALGRGEWNWSLPLRTAGWGLAVAACAGTAMSFRHKPRTTLVVCAALVLSCMISMRLVGAVNEPRHLLMLLPALAFLAAPVLQRRWALAVALALFAAHDFRWTNRPGGEYSPLVDRLNRIPPGPVLLVASDFSESRLIAAIASQSPAAQRQWVSGSKFLATVSWNGEVIAEAFPSVESMGAALAGAELAGVVTLTRPSHAAPAYAEKLRAALERNPGQWRRSSLSEKAALYEWSGAPRDAGRVVPFRVPRLRRVLGGT